MHDPPPIGRAHGVITERVVGVGGGWQEALLPCPGWSPRQRRREEATSHGTQTLIISVVISIVMLLLC